MGPLLPRASGFRGRGERRAEERLPGVDKLCTHNLRCNAVIEAVRRRIHHEKTEQRARRAIDALQHPGACWRHPGSATLAPPNWARYRMPGTQRRCPVHPGNPMAQSSRRRRALQESAAGPLSAKLATPALIA